MCSGSPRQQNTHSSNAVPTNGAMVTGMARGSCNLVEWYVKTKIHQFHLSVLGRANKGNHHLLLWSACMQSLSVVCSSGRSVFGHLTDLTAAYIGCHAGPIPGELYSAGCSRSMPKWVSVCVCVCHMIVSRVECGHKAQILASCGGPLEYP